MLGEVIAFALVMSAFEFVLVLMLPVRVRLRLLGNDNYKLYAHVFFLLLNLWVHWGTIVGTMSSTLSFMTSLGVLAASTALFGKMVGGRYYHVGLIKYSLAEVK